MVSRSKKLFVTVSVLMVALLVFAGAALAQDTEPNTPDTGEKTPVQQMQEWMGAEAWGEMIQHMTQIHGAEFTGQMLQQMNEEGSCHGNGDGFQGMMGNWNGEGAWNTMMNGFRGMMGGFSGASGGMMGR